MISRAERTRIAIRRSSPDGRHVLYFARNPLNQELTGVWVASLEGETSQLLNVNSLAMYAPPGYLLYRRGGNLLAHPFDAGTLSFTGESVSVADDVGYDPAFSGKVTFTVSATGLLAYAGGGIEKSELLWFDRSGNVIGSVGTPANYLNLYLSPDDSKLAVSRTNERTEARDLWQYDLDSGRESQFTFNPASDFRRYGRRTPPRSSSRRAAPGNTISTRNRPREARRPSRFGKRKTPSSSEIGLLTVGSSSSRS